MSHSVRASFARLSEDDRRALLDGDLTPEDLDLDLDRDERRTLRKLTEEWAERSGLKCSK